jgi:hypothetical protein
MKNLESLHQRSKQTLGWSKTTFFARFSAKPSATSIFAADHDHVYESNKA